MIDKNQTIIHECRVYDAKGILKKVVKEKKYQEFMKEELPLGVRQYGNFRTKKTTNEFWIE